MHQAPVTTRSVAATQLAAKILRASALAIAIVGTTSACKQSVDAGTQVGVTSAPATEPGPPAKEPTASAQDARSTDPLMSGELPGRKTEKVDARVTAITLSNKGSTELHTIGAPTASFSPRETVYAEVQSTGTAPVYTLYTKWIGADGTVLSDYGMDVIEPGPKRTVVSLSKPDGWLSGAHRIEIAINGEPQHTAIFRVR